MNEGSVRLDSVELGMTLDDLEGIGNRYAGTRGEEVCRDYMVDRFHQLGLSDVRLEPFDYLAYEPVAASCEVLRPELVEINCNPLQYTASATVESEAVYIGNGTDDDLQRLDRQGVSLAGRIVIAQYGVPL